ncbi:MAG: carbohydrate ABC transporter permease [Tardiphaga sp.]
MNRRRNGTALLFLLPNAAGFLSFTLFPVAAALILSLFEWDIFHPPRFVGMKNFVDLLGGSYDHDHWQANDPRFWKYLGNTFFFMISVPATVFLSLLLAVVLNQKLIGRNLFRTLYFLPTICAGIGLMLLWKFLYNPQFGLINRVLSFIGIEGPDWLDSYHWAKPAIMIMNLWVNVGGTSMILYLAGLQSISPELYEAASLDGAAAWHKFWHITVPLVAPTTFFIAITSIIAGFQGEFDSAYVMTQGGPDGATTAISYYIYNHAFQYFNMGYAASIAVVLFALILVVTLISWRLGGGRLPDA